MDSSKLLKSIKRKARLQLVSLPSTANAEFLEMMNETYANEVVPTIISFREEWFVTSTTWNTTTSKSYRIPSDAIGNKVRGLYLVDDAGKRIRPINFRNRDTVDLVTPNTSAARFNYFPGVEVQDTKLYVDDNMNAKIEVAYYRMPNQIILFDETAPQAVAADKVYKAKTVSGNSLTLENPAPLTSTGTPVEYDIIAPGYPYEKKGTATITFTTPFSANPQTATYTGDTIEVGDWLFLKGKSGYANLPREVEYYFILATAASILNMMGGAEFEQVEAEKMRQLERVKMLLDPRNDGAPWTITDSRGAFDYT